MSQSQSDRSQRRHIMVTGCAGYIGRALARDIISKGESIIGLYHQRLPEALDRMMPLCADLRTPETLLAPLRSVDTVVHMAWSGGIMGAESLRAGRPSRERLMTSGNVGMTLNLVRAMERQNVRRIIFLSWIGADEDSERLLLREKYWAENVILNSKIQEKIILRCSLAIDSDDRGSEFAMATQRISKVPLVTPLPALGSELVFTNKNELVARISQIAVQHATYSGPAIEEVTSTAPISSQATISNFNQKWWGQKKFGLGGFIGRMIFALVDIQFGRLPKNSPKISDFLALSNLDAMLVRFSQKFGVTQK